jgi:Ulp1 family protease
MHELVKTGYLFARRWCNTDLIRDCKGVVVPVSTGNHFYIMSWEINSDIIHVRDSLDMVCCFQLLCCIL